MTEKVKQWIAAGCDYDRGVDLYASMPGHKPVLLKNFKKKPTPQLALKLKYELQQFKAPQPPKEAPQPPKGAKKSAEVKIPEAEGAKKTPLFHQLPPELRDVLLEAHELFRKNCLLKVELNELEAHREEEALAIQRQIYKNIESNAACWQKIDYWLEHKTVLQPALSKISKMNGAQLYRRQQQLYSSKSKLEKRLQENKEALKNTDSVRLHTRLKKAIAKQEANLVKQTRELREVTDKINGTDE